MDVILTDYDLQPPGCFVRQKGSAILQGRVFLMSLILVGYREQNHGNIANTKTGGDLVTLTLISPAVVERDAFISFLFYGMNP